MKDHTDRRTLVAGDHDAQPVGDILTVAAINALRSYEYGNSSPDLAKSVADKLSDARHAPITAFSEPAGAGDVRGEALDCYDAGLLSDFGGGNVEWWQDYIRAELGRAHEFYQSQIAAPLPRASDAPSTAAQGATLTDVKRDELISGLLVNLEKSDQRETDFYLVRSFIGDLGLAGACRFCGTTTNREDCKGLNCCKDRQYEPSQAAAPAVDVAAEDAYVIKRLSGVLAQLAGIILGDESDMPAADMLDKLPEAAQVLKLELDLYRSTAAASKPAASAALHCINCGLAGDPKCGCGKWRHVANAAPSTAAQEAAFDFPTLVNRFLTWPLPESLVADRCVSEIGYQFPRSGTNLLDGQQAEAMLRHVLAAPTRVADSGAMSEAQRTVIMDAAYSLSIRADELKESNTSLDGTWCDADEKTVYEAEVRLIERLRAIAAAKPVSVDATGEPQPMTQAEPESTSPVAGFSEATQAHTPGPWIVRTIDGSIGTIETSDGETIVGQAFDLGIADRMAGHAQRKSNAQLMAASPELLDALRLCYDNGRLYHREIETNNVGEAVRAAIAKATGKGY